jgi:hypothetical protein
MNFKKSYKEAVLFSCSIVCLVAIAGIIQENYIFDGVHVLSPSLVVMIIAGMVILYSLFIGVLALPIFLNEIVSFRRYSILRFLSWFLLPAVYIWLNVPYISRPHPNEYRNEKHTIELLVVNAPVIIGFSISYIRFCIAYHKSKAPL